MNAHTPSFSEENPSVPSSIPLAPFSREEWVSIGMCLRDFFAFPVSGSLSSVCTRLHPLCQHRVTLPVNLTQDDWLEVEYDFNRLFVGPMTLPAPPYAGIYLHAEPQVMGKCTLEVRQLYHQLGYEVPQENSLPDDHIAYEIDACLLLFSCLSPTSAQHDALYWLAHDHLGQWLPRFIDRINNHAPTPVISSVVDVLSLWFFDLQRRTSHA
jgi:TorA maturation chaperone TorD